MSARGLLQNPSLYKGYSETPLECVKTWIEIAIKSELHFMTFHHHLVFMLEKILPKSQRRKFNALSSYEDVLCFLNEIYGFDFKYKPCNYANSSNKLDEIKNGKYILQKTKAFNHNDDILFDVSNLYE